MAGCGGIVDVYANSNKISEIVPALASENLGHALSALRALRRIVSSGHDGTIRMLLSTHGATLGSILPTLISPPAAPSSSSLLHRLESPLQQEHAVENALWVLTNLTAVIDLGETW